MSRARCAHTLAKRCFRRSRDRTILLATGTPALQRIASADCVLRLRPGARETRTCQNGISSSMSLLRAPAPAATARRGAPPEGPPDPKSPPESSEPKLPPPPPPARSSMVSVELKFCSTTSVEYRSTLFWSVHFRVCSWPLDVNLRRLLQILLGDLAQAFAEITTRCHSVFFLALAGVLVAPGLRGCDPGKLAIGRPSWSMISDRRPIADQQRPC